MTDATYRKAVAAFYAAGCRYLQLDDIFFAYLGFDAAVFAKAFG
jgi:methionine synthase II (cobalamin-independent)